VPHHYRLIVGEESLTNEDEGHCPLPRRGGPGAELMLGSLANETSQVEVTNELATKFHRLEVVCSWLEGPDVRIYSLLLGPPIG
jgi:hypothetical protein